MRNIWYDLLWRGFGDLFRPGGSRTNLHFLWSFILHRRILLKYYFYLQDLPPCLLLYRTRTYFLNELSFLILSVRNNVRYFSKIHEGRWKGWKCFPKLRNNGIIRIPNVRNSYQNIKLTVWAKAKNILQIFLENWFQLGLY